MASNTADVLTLVKARLQIKTTDHDWLISSYVEEIGQRVLHYCNLTEVPDGLKFVWSSMTIDVIKTELQSIPEVAAVSGGAVELKVGDTTTKEAPGKAAAKSAIDAVVLNYQVDLNRYRKLRW
jgi:hypothetical protein